MALEGVVLLRAGLARLRRRLRLAMLAVGLGRLLCLCAALALADYAADRLFRLPRGARGALLAAGAGLVAWRLVRDVLRPLTRRLTDEALALEVERRWGGAGGGRADLLAGALWLADGRGWGSDALRGDVVEGAARAVGGFDPASLLRWRRVRRRLAAGLGALGLAAVLAVAGGPSTGLWVRRNLLLSGAEWPRRTRLAALRLPEVVARGEPLRVSVRAEGAIPRSARLRVRGLDSGLAETLDMERTGPATFEARLGGLAESSALSVRAGDALPAQRAVRVEDRPEVAEARLVVRVPDYIATEPVELEWNAPAFDLPRGSRATVFLESTKPLSAVECLIAGRPSPEVRRDGDRSLSFELAGDADLDCRVLLTDTSGLTSAEPFEVRIRVVPDRAPEVRLRAEGVGDAILPRARIPLTLTATDDYGATSAWVELVHEGPDGPRDLGRLDLWEGAAQSPLTRTATLSLAQFDLPARGRLLLRGAARDGCTVEGPNVGRSPVAAFRLVEASELLAALLLSAQDLRRDLEQHVAQQRRLAERFDAWREARAGAPAALVREQRAMAGALKLTAAGYAHVLAQMLNNGLLTEGGRSLRTASIVEPLEALAAADGATARAAAAVGQAAGSAEFDRPALDAMREAVATMQRVRARMMLMEGYASVVASVEEIAAGQGEVLERTRAEQGQALDYLLGE